MRTDLGRHRAARADRDADNDEIRAGDGRGIILDHLIGEPEFGDAPPRRRGARGSHDFARDACAKFGVVLTPDANSAHFNHIHIDAGRYKVCGMRRVDGTLPPELAHVMAGSDEGGAAPPAAHENIADTGAE